MTTKKNKPKVSELTKQGFKRTSIKGLYITDIGKAYNFTTHRNLTTKKGRLTFNGKEYNLAKLVLETFCKTPIRKGQITFINGNRNDFKPSNVKYSTTIKQITPTENNLIKCIRLYFNVMPTFNKKSFLFKYYLNEVSTKRGFEYRIKKNKGSILFFEWLNFGYTKESKSIYKLSLKHGYTATNGKNEIYKYLNMLVYEILEDFKKDNLQVKDFYTPVRKKSKKQVLKQYLKYSKEFNNKVNELQKDIEKRNELINKTVVKIRKQKNHSHFFIVNEFLYESYNTLRGLRYLQVMQVLGMPNEKKCSKMCLFYIVKEYLE